MLFFFQAEDGIRDYDVTGVQTCALPICITIRIDTDILNKFRHQVHEAGGGNYQTLINDALREYLQYRDNILETTLRKVIREELHTIAR